MKVFAVFGNPVAHSISPRLHNMAIQELGLDAVYTRICLEDGEKLIEKFKTLRLSGANITVPHKEVVMPFCDYVDEMALKIGSVNTLVLKNSQICAYNTDGLGFLEAIKPFGDIKNALVLGAGGTAKAVSYALENENIKVTLLNRSPKRLENFVDFERFTWDNFNAKQFDIVINTTSAGLKDEELPAPKEILENVLKQARFAFDVIYNKPTPFLNLAIANGLTCKNGADMLLYQAIHAFYLFFDQSLDEEKLENSMRKALIL
ncbi:MAG: shikimate dehydrogenase [Campylobacter sp.]|nr:shikimate dehydrogenase [Campylobacter sp.]